MEMLDFIKSRRSTRRFAARAIEPEKLEAVLDAGKHAPSGGNNQTWHFIVIQNAEVLNDLNELAIKTFSAMDYDENTYPSLVKTINNARTGKLVFHYNAPALIVVANRKNYGNALVDSACAIENMMLMANALDMGSCYINQLHWLDEDAGTRAYLEARGLGANETICGAVALGYAETESGLPARTPLPRKDIPVTMI